METKPEAAVEAVAEVVGYRVGGSSILKWNGKPRPIGTLLYPQSALDALRGEVAALREADQSMQDELGRQCARRRDAELRAAAAERRVAQLETILEQAMAHPDFLPPGLLESIETALTKVTP